MTKVVIDMSVSLDGFVAGPQDGRAHPLGINGGEPTSAPISSLQASRCPVRGRAP
jgi:hypothetical protein